MFRLTGSRFLFLRYENGGCLYACTFFALMFRFYKPCFFANRIIIVTSRKMSFEQIIEKYCRGNIELKEIITRHSQSVADKALRIAEAHPELGVDKDFLYEAAMLHDIGVVKADAPGIKCFGSEPYICHGILGAEMLRAEGLPRHARVCERHTGAGLSKEDIINQGLPLPHADFLPETIEEKLICYADKFFSKTRLDEEKTLEQAERSVGKHGEAGLVRFREWAEMFK